ncbi:uncharacterized protein TNCT_714561 [Trichonephila clavata]|uniref:Uncharacterized protein n=1 Tax=Trichonephila clavata TaxID=2740835 RepID=A0A8X6HTM1_TRICU|nr:uncharacterized protein TNCT_714561 [Trichonephila clavata]
MLYHEGPQYYPWNQLMKKICRRKRGAKHSSVSGIFSTSTLEKVYTVHPNNRKCYYLRMLLHGIKEPTSFQAIKTIEGQVCQTYREACFKLGMLENDKKWDDALTEVSKTRQTHKI